jgi:hypothetical protein
MFPALIRLIATQPAWVAGHAEAYVDLLTAEVGAASAVWKRRALLSAVALCSTMVAATLAGVAVMLAVLAPAVSQGASCALLLTPLCPLLMAALCLWAARNGGAPQALVGVREQVKADMVMLREMGA